MKALVLIEDVLLRDQVRAGLMSCKGIEVSYPEDSRSIHRVKSKWDWIWFSADSEDSGEVIREIRAHNRHAFLIVLGDAPTLEKLKHWKDHLKIFSLLPLPLQASEFFKTVSRLQTRLTPV